MARTRSLFLLSALTLAGTLPSWVRADDVDDLLALKARNRDRVRHFSAEYTVETDQPKRLPNAKTVRMRYRLDWRRLRPGQVKNPKYQWQAEIEVLEPGHTKMRLEGDQVSFQNPDGTWQIIPMTDEQRQQVSSLVEPFLGRDPVSQRQQFAFKVTRTNRPLFGPKTKTLESIPKEKHGFFARMEEDIAEDGLPLATRLYDDKDRETVLVTVTQHSRRSGVPVMEASAAVSQTPAGEMSIRTTCAQIQIETEGGE